MYFDLGQPGPPPKRERRRLKVRDLREYAEGLIRYPKRTLSDIAVDRPWPWAAGVLGAILATAGLGLGATGLPGLPHGALGAMAGALSIALGGSVAFSILALALHGMARSLEGWASYSETYSALAFALFPLILLGPASLLRLVPGAAGGLLFFTAALGIAAWAVRLTYVAIREANRFTGLQAWLTIMTPVALFFLVTFVGGVIVGTAIVLSTSG